MVKRRIGLAALGAVVAWSWVAIAAAGDRVTVIDRRANWPEFLCELHSFPLLEERTPHTGGTPSSLFMEAVKGFPNSNLSYGGCLVLENTEYLIKYCEVCRVRDRQWRAENLCVNRNTISNTHATPFR